ncbi:MAG: GNAT family N-acetyltransferase [candidate division Zixibacteria bacterium]|nr:GNAT family N-acetyltransferase [candidate division Zixibacteria bacterium]
MEYNIRKLEMPDYDDLMNLWQKSGLPYRPKGRDSRELMAFEFKREETCFLGMFDNGKLIGAIVGTSDGRKGWINRLAIDPEYRGQGLAKTLIEECEKFLFGLGLMIIAALIEDYNNPSKNLFGKVGYKFTDNVHYFSKRLSDDV